MFLDHIEQNFHKSEKRLIMQKTIRLRWSHVKHWVGKTDYKVHIIFIWGDSLQVYGLLRRVIPWNITDSSPGARPQSNTRLDDEEKCIWQVIQAPWDLLRVHARWFEDGVCAG